MIALFAAGSGRVQGVAWWNREARRCALFTDDLFGRLDYRRFVAWKPRIEREMPFLLETFGKPGKGPLLDIGCGTGEHAAALAGKGYAVVGLDRSPAMIEKARAAYARPRFVQGEMARVPLRGEGFLGGAYCLGNTLVNLLEDEEYAALFGSVRSLLAPGAPLLIQIVNFHRILEKGVRHLPLNFRKTDEGEVLFLRLLDPIDERRIRFEMVTVERRPPDGESRIAQATSSVLRPLRDRALAGLLEGAGFESVRLFGSYRPTPYDSLESHDLIVVAR
ncbi:MAG: methyltransferase domain-containing protein [Candidatus Eisenbacteria bacterium]